MTRELTVAVIGCGRMGADVDSHKHANLAPGWAPNNHADAASSVPGLRLIAFCDTNRARAEAAASRHGGGVYTDYRAMLADRVPDIVTVATRAEGRAAIIAELAAAGVRAIHAEKPLCRNLREGEAAAASLDQHGVAFSYGATRRYMEAYRLAQELVRSGRFGSPRQIHLHFGAGALQWTHPHSVDLAMYFAGDAEPESAQGAFLHPVAARENLLDADPLLAMGSLRFPGGFTALISAASGCDMTVACEGGTVSVLSDGETVECRAQSKKNAAYFNEVEKKAMQPSMSGLQVAFTELHDAVMGGTPPASGIKQALAGQRALFALALSGLRNGVETKLAEVSLDFTITGRQGALYA